MHLIPARTCQHTGHPGASRPTCARRRPRLVDGMPQRADTVTCRNPPDPSTASLVRLCGLAADCAERRSVVTCGRLVALRPRQDSPPRCSAALLQADHAAGVVPHVAAPDTART